MVIVSRLEHHTVLSERSVPDLGQGTTESQYIVLDVDRALSHSKETGRSVAKQSAMAKCSEPRTALDG